MSSRGYAAGSFAWTFPPGKTHTVETSTYAGRFLGGRGLGAGIYWDEVPPDAAPFHESNRLVISTGPLAGIPALGGSRWGVCAKSGLDAQPHYNYGNLGGTFGAELKFAGYDCIVVQGAAERLVTIDIRGIA